ncbi:phage major capsid protein [Tropicimonas sp. IMCC34043]|uniref:phage major capsid protein n=1 Tax=Tropicimonas sp. IMCC34043 TaxID=2248760 RepID=UPI000E25C255|nr:phage major capsid protein [Tropicimonas sp. IMCC34043]
MNDAETKARAGKDVPDVQTAMTGFLNDFRNFQADMKSKILNQEERLNMLDRKTTFAGRPALATAAEPMGAPHQKAFEAYLRSGDVDALRSVELEAKALSTADGDGYLVGPDTAETIRGILQSGASLRAVSNVVAIEGSSFEVFIDENDLGSTWANEASTIVDTESPVIHRIQIPLHELSAMPKVSQRLLDDSAFDIDTWLATRIADKFARAEAAAFINGDGVDKPKGFLDYPLVANDAWAWGSVGYIPTGSNGGFSTADPLIDLVYALGSQYRSRASFVMNSKTTGVVRKLRDGDGRFLWVDGMASGEPARLLGYRVLISEDMPDMSSLGGAIAFGDFSAGYTIAERPDLRVLRDPFSAKPHVLFYATKRVGGDVSDFAAIKVLKFSAA